MSFNLRECLEIDRIKALLPVCTGSPGILDAINNGLQEVDRRPKDQPGDPVGEKMKCQVAIRHALVTGEEGRKACKVKGYYDWSKVRDPIE